MATVNILVVDDDRMVRQMIATLLVDMGFSVVEAASSQMAKNHLALADVDVLLCDDELGGNVSGTEFVALDRDMMPPVVVIMSGNPRPRDLPHGARYLSKPFTMSQLERAVQFG